MRGAVVPRCGRRRARPARRQPEGVAAVAGSDLPAGSIGAVLGEDVERCSAEVGYWLGEPYWGRGIATRALVGFTRLAFAAYGVERLFAVPLAANAACWRRPATGWRAAMRRSAVKDGVVQDQLLYAVLRGRWSDGFGSQVAASDACEPAPGMLSTVHCQHNDRVVRSSEVDRIRKTLKHSAPSLASYLGKRRWILGDSRHRIFQSSCELGAEPRTPPLVPTLSFQCLGFGLGAEADGAGHRLL